MPNPKYAHTYCFHTITANGGAPQTAKFGDALELYLAKNKMTIPEFVWLVAKESYKHGIRFTKSDVYNYLSGKCCPKNDKLIAICTATGETISFWTGHWGNTGKVAVMRTALEA